MADTSSDKKILVDSYTGGTDGDELIDCYFKLKHDGTYDFHDKDDHSKCSGLTVGTASPSFQLDEYPGVSWTITLTNPCSDTVVNGNWTSLSTVPEGSQDGGTFQAQAGGGVEEDEEDADAKAQQDLLIYEVKSSHGLDFGKVLIGCSFSLDGNSGDYKLKDPLGGVLHEKITWTDTFDFKFISRKWRMTSDIFTLEAKAHGRWTLLDSETGEEVDGGTFQAQAGGGGVEETAYSATAS